MERGFQGNGEMMISLSCQVKEQIDDYGRLFIDGVGDVSQYSYQYLPKCYTQIYN